jgi:3D (Asp-Asp-Asp) domain-containing protein
MQKLIPVLVGLILVLPWSATAPVDTANAATRAKVASTTLAVAQPVAPKVAFTSIVKAPMTTKLTAYNALPEQTDSTPFTTASGAFSNPEVVAARSRDLAYALPYGTVIKIERTAPDTPSCMYKKVEEQIGYRVIADAMNPRIVNTVDVLLDHNNVVPVGTRLVNPGLALGKCGSATITVVGKISVKDIPSTQAELAAMVESSRELALR